MPAPVLTAPHAAEWSCEISPGRENLSPSCGAVVMASRRDSHCYRTRCHQLFLFTGFAAWCLCCALAVTSSLTDHRITRQGKYYICRFFPGTRLSTLRKNILIQSLEDYYQHSSWWSRWVWLIARNKEIGNEQIVYIMKTRKEGH
jgi:hypothetical protein